MAEAYKGSIYEPVFNSYNSKTDTQFPFPSHNVDPAKKNEAAWCLAWNQSIFYRYIKNRTAFNYDQGWFFQQLRSYAAGLQDTNKYKKPLLGKGKDGTAEWERKGWRNVNWEIFSPMPKYLRSLIGKFDSIEHNLLVKALDKRSGDEREDKMWGAWYDTQFQKEMQSLSMSAGAQQEQPAIMPESLDELQLFNEMGGFKVKAEISMKKALDHTEEISDVRELKRKIIEDGINLNIMAFRDYYDPITCKQKYGYIDPAKMVVQYSRKNNFKDGNFWGYYEDYSIAELRVLTGADETQLYNVAKKWGTYNGVNNSFWSWSNFEQYFDAGTNRYAYDDFKVTVFHAEWFSSDKRYKTTKTKANGEVMSYVEDFGKSYNTEKRKTKVTEALNVYHCSWVIDTEFVWDYGKVPDTPRESKKTPSLSLHAYKLPGKSITETARPILDQIQLCWLQLQNALAAAAPKGFAIEYTALQNVNLGDRNMKPNELIKMYNQTGRLVYRAVTVQGKIIHQGTPIHELPGGIGEFLNESIAMLNMHFNFLVELMGLERFGGTGGGEQTATEVQLSVAATNDATKLLYSGWLNMRESAAKNSCSRIQSLVKYNKDCYDAYYPVLGEANLEVLKLGESMTADQWGLSFKARPTDKMLAEINQAAVEAMKVGKNGQPGISFPQYLTLLSLLEDGNVEYARAVLSRMISKAEQQAEATAQERIKLQGEEIRKQSIVAEEEKRKTMKLEAQLKMASTAIEAIFSEKAAQSEAIRSFQQTYLESVLNNPDFTQLLQGINQPSQQQMQPAQQQ